MGGSASASTRLSSAIPVNHFVLISSSLLRRKRFAGRGFFQKRWLGYGELNVLLGTGCSPVNCRWRGHVVRTRQGEERLVPWLIHNHGLGVVVRPEASA